MKLKDILTYPFVDWHRPIAIFFITFPIFLLTMLSENGLLIVIGTLLWFIGIGAVVISTLLLLFKGQWAKMFLYFIIHCHCYHNFWINGLLISSTIARVRSKVSGRHPQKSSILGDVIVSLNKLILL